jgi:hypothetical protein
MRTDLIAEGEMPNAKSIECGMPNAKLNFLIVAQKRPKDFSIFLTFRN